MNSQLGNWYHTVAFQTNNAVRLSKVEARITELVSKREHRSHTGLQEIFILKFSLSLKIIF